MEARIWAAEVRDGLHGPARKDQATSLAQLRRLLKTGEDSLRVVPLQELQSFRRVLNEAKLISKEAKGVMASCDIYFAEHGMAKLTDDQSEPDIGGAVSTDGGTDAAANDGDEDDEDTDSPRDGSKKRGAGKSYVDNTAKEFTMEYLKCLIDRFHGMPTAPVLRRELSDINKIMSEAQKLTRDVHEVLVKGDTCAVRKYK
jgi:hypothetical protein